LNKKLLTFTLTLALWFVFAGRINIQIFLLGTIICSIISLMLADSLFRFVHMKVGTKDFFLKVYYLFWVILTFIYDVFLSAVRISKHAFEMKPSFYPRTVRMKTSLENPNSLAILVNFITLTQGTLAMDFDILNQNYLIHWIDVQSDDEAKRKQALISKQENLIAKLFD
jgi:multicomponent Na+:H+ antiporter subunit E